MFYSCVVRIGSLVEKTLFSRLLEGSDEEETFDYIVAVEVCTAVYFQSRTEILFVLLLQVLFLLYSEVTSKREKKHDRRCEKHSNRWISAAHNKISLMCGKRCVVENLRLFSDR